MGEESKTKRPDAVTILAIWHFFLAIPGVIGACAVMVIPIPIVVMGSQGIANIALALIALVVLMVISLGGGVLPILAGWGLLRLKNWARWLAIVMAAPMLLFVPIGTIIAAAVIWYLFTDGAKAAFGVKVEPKAAGEAAAVGPAVDQERPDPDGVEEAEIQPDSEEAEEGAHDQVESSAGEEAMPDQPEGTVSDETTVSLALDYLAPYPVERILLCSADASPASQRDKPGPAGHLFPRATWVGAIRNAADRLGCRFVVLTTAYGMVDSEDVVAPFDLPIEAHRDEVAVKWQETVPSLVGDEYDIVLFYAGGTSREPYIETLQPILRDLGVDLITYGKPSVADANRTEQVVGLLTDGTTLDQIRAVLGQPERLEFYTR